MFETKGKMTRSKEEGGDVDNGILGINAFSIHFLRIHMKYDEEE